MVMKNEGDVETLCFITTYINEVLIVVEFEAQLAIHICKRDYQVFLFQNRREYVGLLFVYVLFARCDCVEVAIKLSHTPAL